MTHKIIALVDGSAYSKSVCDHAAWIAGRGAYAVELMHVLGRRESGAGSDRSGAISLGARSSLLEELSALDEQRAKLSIVRGRAILEDAKALVDAADVKTSEHLRHGDLMEAISEKEGDAEMLLIGKRGEAADFAKGHLGSNLERVVRAVSKPLFIASRAFRPIGKVLIAYDGSASAMRAVDYVARSPLYTGLKIKIVTIGSATDAAKKRLEDAKAMLSAAGLDAEIGILPGQPEDALGKLIEEADFDHLVMGASGHSRLRSLFVGSTSMEMIRTCKVPILLVR
ncbi:Nucleotide-binding universal stress protein, UspA family [Roseivivax halotolerans]|uniref:Nucleotide-binding universal stress protein, UspA family n=1 Tax=Roseivivax halotolerans TaxID=93684 RepID=A0A1I6A8G1_9RHOB|nr:universal stress protein [Roseivivax halotolerans]SFQ64969.1 Nucleotide-binding universal stress protein, UspA family [Roseivivax halotolerans]